MSVTGSEILEIANACYRPAKRNKPGRYAGFQWMVAVGQAKQAITDKRGRARRDEAEHTTTVLFDHARKQAQSRIDTIVMEAQADGFSASTDSELYAFANEVQVLLNGPLSAGFGVFDPSMIVTLIMGIINAIKACKNPTPVPVPA